VKGFAVNDFTAYSYMTMERETPAKNRKAGDAARKYHFTCRIAIFTRRNRIELPRRKPRAIRCRSILDTESSADSSLRWSERTGDPAVLLARNNTNRCNQEAVYSGQFRKNPADMASKYSDIY
jgi:hypothetical protein